MAKLLGTPLMPWQQQVLDVGMEIDPDTGLMAYREVIVTVPRQSGKTSGIVLPVEVDRCTMWDEPQRVIYTAQTGSDARRKLLEDQVPVLERSKLKGLIQHIHRAQGNENIHWKTGARISVAASSQDSGHGFTLDLGVLDECWKDEDDRREQAMLPAMATRPNAQLLLTSTMGTARSVYLNRKVEAGRHATKVNSGGGIAYFEWSLPLDADIDNPDVWWDHMPALGWTISEEAVTHARQTMEEAEWRRAYANQPTLNIHDRVIPEQIWEMVQDPLAVLSGRLIYAVDILPDRSASAISASDGESVELIEHRGGTHWVIERIVDLVKKWGGSAVIDGGGSAAYLADDLERQQVPVERLSNPGYVAACARMFDRIADGKLRVRPHPDMDEAVEGLAKRPVGDRFVWSRSTSSTDITPFVAATLALSVEEEPPPTFYAFE